MNTYKSITLGLLGITAMLASCSQDEVLQNPTAGKNLVKVTAQLPDGIKTRSAATEGEQSAIKRCILAVYKTDGTFVEKMEDTTPDDGFTFQFEVDNAESQYNYYCWADDGTSYTTDDNLTNIKVNTSLPAIAQRGEALDKSLSADGDVTVTMTHAVAKISLKSTANFSGAEVKVKANTHKAYNAQTGKVTDGTTAVEKSQTDVSVSGATSSAPQEVFSFYVLVNADEANQTVTVSHNGAEEEVANVPIKADWCTTLKGDVAQVGLVDYTVTATIDKDWEDANAYYPEEESVNAETYTITTKMGGEIAKNTDWIAKALNGGSELSINGLMNDADIAAIKTYLKENAGTKLELNLAGAKLTVLPGTDILGSDSEWPGLVSIKLPEGLTTISSNAFRNCADLASVTLPTTLKTIESSAFAYCTGLAEIALPSSLETIDYSAFFDCSGLKTMDLSNTKVATINANLFNGCSSLTSVSFGPNTNEFRSKVFVDCSSLTSIDLSLCAEVPSLTYSTSYAPDSPFYGRTDITVHVKDEAMKTAFESSPWVSQVGFSADNFVVKE